MVEEDMRECPACDGIYDANEGECPNCDIKREDTSREVKPKQARANQNRSGLPTLVVEIPKTEHMKQREDRMRRVLGILAANSRTKLTEISRQTGIPISTVWDYMTIIEAQYDFTIQPKKAGEKPGKK